MQDLSFRFIPKTGKLYENSRQVILNLWVKKCFLEGRQGFYFLILLS